MHNKTLPVFYKRLLEAFGPQHWWPAETRFEVIVGAILTQNTNWGNVEKALVNLKAAHLLSPQALYKVTIRKLAKAIRPAGYFNVKARRLKNFIQFFIHEYDGHIEKMGKEDLVTLRHKLLEVNGIGPETADSILLYALDKPIFVVDAYTRRLLVRHGIVPEDVMYHQMQEIFQQSLSADVKLFNEYHALIVKLGKDFCRPKPKCEECPVFLAGYKPIASVMALS